MRQSPWPPRCGYVCGVDREENQWGVCAGSRCSFQSVFLFLLLFQFQVPGLGAFLVGIVQCLVGQDSAVLVEVFLPQSILLTRRRVHVHGKPRYLACEICWRRWILKF